jgi:5-methylcytosine-specific restriction endonuclease McrA
MTMRKSQKNRYKGLKFNYKIGDQVLMDKYLTVEDFLNTDFTKNNNPMSPVNDTEIFNIYWNGFYSCINGQAKTIFELKTALINGYDISNTIICLKKQKKKNSVFQRKSIHSIEEIRELTKDVLFEQDKRNAKVDLDGDIIKGNSQRYQTFFTKGTKCVCCGIEGKYFAKERDRKSDVYHLNLYAIDENGEEVLMTKDHIIPRSKGGKDNISNYQTMCERCNEAKGNNLNK